MTVAVIDCGTNTFTLSLFEITSSGQFKRSLKQRHYVELAEEGIDTIGPNAFQRGIDAFHAFRIFLNDYPSIKTLAIGTAALRRASNQKAFIDAAKAVSNITIKVIDGPKEANLIYQGVRLAAPLGDRPSLIMDIGGGSVEFIIANQQTLYWAKSYPIGVAVLYDLFHKNDPITINDIHALNAHLETTLHDLIKLLPSYSIEHLIGASGSFDVLDNMIGAKKKHELYGYIYVDDFNRVRQQLVQSTFEQRLHTKNITSTRAKLIVMSVLLIDFIHQKIDAPNLVASEHAMREGLIEDLLNK